MRRSGILYLCEEDSKRSCVCLACNAVATYWLGSHARVGKISRMFQEVIAEDVRHSVYSLLNDLDRTLIGVATGRLLRSASTSKPPYLREILISPAEAALRNMVVNDPRSVLDARGRTQPRNEKQCALSRCLSHAQLGWRIGHRQNRRAFPCFCLQSRRRLYPETQRSLYAGL